MQVPYASVLLKAFAYHSVSHWCINSHREILKLRDWAEATSRKVGRKLSSGTSRRGGKHHHQDTIITAPPLKVQERKDQGKNMGKNEKTVIH